MATLECHPAPPDAADGEHHAARQRGHRLFTTQELFDTAVEVVIDHMGQIYRLRITRQNKLLLTK